MERKYLLNGQEVVFHGGSEGQYIVEDIYENEYGEDYYSGEKYIVKKIFNEVPTIKYNDIIKKLENEKHSLKKEIDELKTNKKKLENDILKIDKISFLKNLKKPEDVDFLMQNLKFTPTNEVSSFKITQEGEWGKYYLKLPYLFYKWYDNKKELLELCEFLNIEIPNKLKNFKLPKDFTPAEIREILIKRDFYKTNSEYLKNNIEGFFETGKVQLQEVLKHPSILDNFDILLEYYKSDNFDCWKFDCLLEYNEEQLNIIKEIVKQKTHFFESTLSFIKRNKNTFFSDKEFCDKVKTKISLNCYSEFWVLNFPIEYQVKYFKEIGIEQTFDFFSNSDNSKLFKKGYLEEIMELMYKKEE